MGLFGPETVQFLGLNHRTGKSRDAWPTVSNVGAFGAPIPFLFQSFTLISSQVQGFVLGLLPACAGKLHRFCTISAPRTAFSAKRPLACNDLRKNRSSMVQFCIVSLLDHEKTETGKEKVKQW